MIDMKVWQESTRLRSRRGMIVVLVLSACASIAFVRSLPLLEVAIGAIFALASAVVALKRPPLGVVGLVLLSFFIPVSLGTGTSTNVNLSVIGLAGIVILYLLHVAVGRPSPIGPIVNSVYLPLILFIASAFLSFLVGQLPWYPVDPAPMDAQAGQLAVLVLLPFLVLIMDLHIQRERWLRRLVWLFLGLGAGQIFFFFYPSIRSALSFILNDGPTGSLFWIWMVSLAFGQAVFNHELDKLWRILLGGIVLVSLYVGLVVNFTWASGWLPPLMALMGILWAAKPRLAAVLSAVFLIVAAFSATKLVDLLLINEEYSAATRLAAWKIVVGMALQKSPIFGFGPANYRFYTIEYPILGWNVLFNSHNQYVDLLAQTGLLGTGAFAWFSASIGTLIWRLKDNPKLTGFLRALALSLFGGLVGTLVCGMLADWFFPFVYNITLNGMRSAIPGWIMLGAALSLNRIVHGKEGAGPDSGSLLPAAENTRPEVP